MSTEGCASVVDRGRYHPPAGGRHRQRRQPAAGGWRRGGRSHSPARRDRHHGGDPAPLSRGLPHGSSRHHRGRRTSEPFRHTCGGTGLERRKLRRARPAGLRLPALPCAGGGQRLPEHRLPFPSLSTGAYRYPVSMAARTALSAVIEFLEEREAPELVRFVLFDEATYRAYAGALSAAARVSGSGRSRDPRTSG